ncbi:MAG: HAMP domain-containing protein [Bernardetiaceae bacterium]|nr:HAMP domain-containing protein [Bernardetiaceae bacterium]
MKIRTQLTLLFTLLTAGILAVFAIVIYVSAERNRTAEFYKNLEKEALTKAYLLLDTDIAPSTLQTIYRRNREWISEVEVAIYNADFQLLYHDAVDIDFVKETPEMLEEVLAQGELRFSQQKWDILGLAFSYKNQTYIISAAAYDAYGYGKIENLKKTIALTFLASLLVIYVAGRYLAMRALSPVSNMVEEVRHITARNLNLRISEGRGRDELTDLARTFNEMLNRLERSFEAQKSFVSNIAHELRTPLSLIISEAEWALGKERDTTIYKKTLYTLLADAQSLSRLVSVLLDLAKASYDVSKILFKPLRIDELLFEARNEVLKSMPNYQVTLHIDTENHTESQNWEVYGNAYLIKTALTNFIENGCKFSSDKCCKVSVQTQAQRPLIKIQDKGIGIPASQLQDIFEPFFRADNATEKGTGIGLSLSKKIMDLHKVRLEVESVEGQGTTILLYFP